MTNSYLFYDISYIYDIESMYDICTSRLSFLFDQNEFKIINFLIYDSSIIYAVFQLSMSFCSYNLGMHYYS